VTVPAANVTDVVALPSAHLDWVGAPRIDLGYRLAEGCGEFLASYRSIVSDGRAVLVDFEGPGMPGALKSRLNVNVLDLLYGSREYSLSPLWELNWRAGVRVAGVYTDSRAFGTILGQAESSNFVGAGPHVGLEVARHFESAPGIAVFGRLETSLLVGHVHQSFEETADFTSLGGTLIGGATSVSSTQVVPVLAFQVGLSYTPVCVGRWSRYSLGYEFQQWWNMGQAGGSTADLTTNGVFFRAEFSF
jgi:hypothetical protein